MKLNSKGQVTIPAQLRARHGLHEGDDVDVVEEDGRLVVVRSETGNTRGQRLIERMRGRASTGMGTDDLLGLLRAE